MTEPDPLVNEFLVESRENLDRLDRDLIALEQNPRDRERLAGVFRTVHTIKGTCGFFGFGRLEKVAHVGEGLLARLRDGELPLDAETAAALLALVDAIRTILARVEAAGDEGDADHADLIATLTRLAARPPVGRVESSRPDARGSDRAESPRLDTSRVGPRRLDPTYKTRPAASPAMSGEIVLPSASGEVPNPLWVPPPTNAPPPAADTTVRVDVALLDRLMNLVGELVLTRNQMLRHAAADPTLQGTAQRLNHVTADLQDGVMKTRMRPIGTAWGRLPRAVRDLAATWGKQVRVVMEGEATELDRTLIEAIKDPLTHVIRNAIDHGIEWPADRVAAGKPAEGTLRLRAFHEGGLVNIEVTDDGAGIIPEKVRAAAVTRGLIDPARSAVLTDDEVTRLVFMPGFSTAAAVTRASGRGVGLDVLKTNVEGIGGAVDLDSRPGRGTTVRIKIPLTLAIIPALFVSCGRERYAVPQASLQELIRLDGAARGRIESFRGAPVYRLRGELLPLVSLRDLLGVEPRSDEDDASVTIVVLRAAERPFGLVVDGVHDAQEIVVKPLGRLLRHLTVFAGATIEGDGRVALILDVPGVAARSHVHDGRDPAPAQKPPAKPVPRPDLYTVLLVGCGADRRVGVPLPRVARLEEMPAAAVEWSDGREVMRYRGAILPLVRLNELIGGPAEPPPDGERLSVVVVTDGGRTAGLVVGRILDVVETPLDVRRASRRPGLAGSAVIRDRVTDLIDVRAVLELVEAGGA